MKSNKSSSVSPAKTHSQFWFESVYRDIERLIERLTAPYIDSGNVALHADELREECWWKVARLMGNGTLERCKTRQQFFGFLKVSLKNHIKSHLSKHLLTAKRTGIDPNVLAAGRRSFPRKTFHVRVDDPTVTVQLLSPDPGQEFGVLLRDFQRMLTPGEIEMLAEIINSDEPANTEPDATRWLRKLFRVFIEAEPESQELLGRPDQVSGD